MYTADAKCTIQGTSYGVEACDFDFAKQQLAVASNWGVTVFRDLMVMEDAYTAGLTIPGFPVSISVNNGNMLLGTETLTYTYRAPYYPDVSTEWMNKPLAITGTTAQNTRRDVLWIELSETASLPLQLTLSLQSTRWATLYGGVVYAGIAETYGDKDPKYGIKISRVDYSIEDENSNGSDYLNMRDIVRPFSVEMLLTHDNAFKLLNNYDAIGKNPSAWKLTKKNNTEWIVFAKFVDPPQMSYDHQTHSNVSFELKEVI